LKKFLSLLMIFALLLSLAACGGGAAPAEETPAEETPAETPAEETPAETSGLGYKIGVVTGTVSQGEEEYRAAEKVKALYGEDVILQTYPDNFMKEQETTISNILSIASDPEVKAIVVVQGIPGTSAAIDKVKELRDDILFVVGVPGEDPDMIASKADVVFQADELGMGTTIIDQAIEMGAKTFVHYSFPRHMSYQLLSMRRDIFKEYCAEKGLEFVDATAPDPTGDAGVPGAQQFILEDIPRKIEEYGKDTCFFSTNCSMQEPLIKSALEGGAIVAQQCCPSPYHGYPGALGIEIPDDKRGDIDYVISEISAKIAEKGGTGRFSTWPVPVNMMFVESGVEYARAYIEGKTNGKVDKEMVGKLFSDYAGKEVKLSTFTNEETGKVNENFFMVLSGYITF
jgi:predicted small lipoprotein YifL